MSAAPLPWEEAAQRSAVMPWDEAKASAPNAGLAPPAGGPHSFPVEKSNLGIAAGSENTERSAIANPQQPAEQFGLEHPEEQGKLLGASAIGAAGAAGVAGAPVVIPALRAAARAHPIVSGMLASEAISQARKIPYVGKFVPPYAEMLPMLFGGKGKGAESEPEFPGATEPTATPEQLNPALVSPSRSLPGQIGPEVIRPRIAPAEPIPARSGLALPPGPADSMAESVAPQATPSGAGIPRTFSGESALRQVLGGQDNANLLKIARSRGINVTQEAQLKPGVADEKLIEKIVNNFSDDELDGFRSTYIENGGRGAPGSNVRTNMESAHPGIWNKVGEEANKALSMQTYFPDVKIPAATLRRTQSALSTARNPLEVASPTNLLGRLKQQPAVATAETPATVSDSPDLLNALKESLKQARAKKLPRIAKPN